MAPKRHGSPTSKTNQKHSQRLSATRSSSTTAQFHPAQFRPAQFHPAVQSQSSTEISDILTQHSTGSTSHITSLTVVKSNGKTQLRKESQRHRNIDHTINEDIIIQDAENLSQLNEIPQYTAEESISIEQLPEPLKSQKRNHKTSAKLNEWVKYQNEFLDELLRHDGKSDYTSEDKCSECKKESGYYKCKDCFHGSLLQCKKCVIKGHEHLPLHCIEKWNGSYFEKDSLRNLGLCIQLGHGGALCSSPANATVELVVVDITGVHCVSAFYCDCRTKMVPQYTQLLHASWFPASFTTLYDWYHTLCKKTDKCKLEDEKNHYNEFQHVIGQHTEGITGTKKGELTVECPACSHPDKNLPEDWEKSGPLKFLYIIYLAVDTNFKLSCKERGIQDVELMPGWGPYIEEQSYQKHLESRVENPEISTCDSEHDAILQAGIRSAPGHSVTGTALVICSRHTLIRPNGAGDLQKGERYCNIDFIVLSTLIGVSLSWIVITYDIGCQWSKNLKQRIETYPESMRIPPNMHIDVGVPSWHINGHGSSCQSTYALGYLPGAGRTCGEEVETTWSSSNHLRPSTCEMGPASHHEVLNDQWIAWNFQKTIGFSIIMSEKHKKIFDKFNATFESSITAECEAQVIAWNMDHTKPNPYDDPECTTTLQDVRLELTREDVATTEKGIISKHKLTLTKFLIKGFELEEQQHLLKIEVSKLKNNPGSKDLADIEDKCIALAAKISKWQEIQLTYMPEVKTIFTSNLEENTNEMPEEIELIPLYLPSALPAQLHTSSTIKKAVQSELKLRLAQANDALAYIRHYLQIISSVKQFKLENTSGTGNKSNTCMRDLHQKYKNKSQLHVDSVLSLDPNGNWQSHLLELKNEDVQGPGKNPDDISSSGRFEMSWIWLVPRNSSGDDEENNSLKLEWVKAHARKERWQEEVLILREEMQ
ncbi:hypothetical protein BDQ17DRAFT_1393808 [Cyathus striatus]|nr:hypothetical protein BDQ17DRAFT_1393808 [Cyathus striatus]